MSDRREWYELDDCREKASLPSESLELVVLESCDTEDKDRAGCAG